MQDVKVASMRGLVLPQVGEPDVRSMLPESLLKGIQLHLTGENPVLFRIHFRNSHQGIPETRRMPGGVDVHVQRKALHDVAGEAIGMRGIVPGVAPDDADVLLHFGHCVQQRGRIRTEVGGEYGFAGIAQHPLNDLEGLYSPQLAVGLFQAEVSEPEALRPGVLLSATVERGLISIY